MSNEPTPTDDIIDSRDVLDAIKDLEANEERDPEEQEYLDVLIAFSEAGASASEDWEYGAVCVADAHFEDYARDLAEECAPSREAQQMLSQWPYCHIDWEEAANALKDDYTSIEFDGYTFWTR